MKIARMIPKLHDVTPRRALSPPRKHAAAVAVRPARRAYVHGPRGGRALRSSHSPRHSPPS